MTHSGVDRRDFLKYGALTISVLPFLNSAPVSADTTVVRKRSAVQTTDGQAMLLLYRKGVDILKNQRPQYHPTSWLFQARIHLIPPEDAVSAAWDQIFNPNQSNDPLEQAKILEYRKLALDEANNFQNRLWATCPHSSSQGVALDFLSWHRFYLYWFEQIIEAAVGQTFALPYWDYTNPGHDVLPLEFREEINGRQKNNSLYSEDRNTGLNSLTNPKQFPTAQMSWSEAAKANDTLPIDPQNPGFSLQLEGTPHADIHNFVGTMMGMANIQYAARDPIFWLHHANIDRLWESWRKSPGKTDPSSAQWLDAVHRFAKPDGTLSEMTARTQLETRSLGYEYDILEQLPAAPGPVAAIVSSASAAPPAVLAQSPANVPALNIVDGQVATTLAVAPAAMASLAAAANQPGQLKLVLRGIKAESGPGTRLGVYVNLPANPTEADYGQHWVGSLALFGSTRMPFSQHAHSDFPEVASTREFPVRPDQLGANNEVTVTVRPLDRNVAVPVVVQSISIEQR